MAKPRRSTPTRWPSTDRARKAILKRLDEILKVPHLSIRELSSLGRLITSIDRSNLALAAFEHATRTVEAPDDDFRLDLSTDEADPSAPA